MSAVSRLYNPFRDEKKASDADKALLKDFSFEIQSLNQVSFDNDDSVNVSAADDPNFDPFHVVHENHVHENHYSPKEPQSQSKWLKLKGGSNKENSQNKRSVTKSHTPSIGLAPKLVVKLATHEEATSRVKMALDEFDVTSEVFVEGVVYAQVQCSDARKNAPFALLVPRAGNDSFTMIPNEKYATARDNTGRCPLVVTIPKQELLRVPIARYSFQKELKFMPVLVERKVTRNGIRVRVAIQVRSCLDNTADMKDMTILVAVPEKVNQTTVRIARGTAVWDELKRTIKWKIPALVKGQSALVIAEADLWAPPGEGEDETPFPVMFRCSSDMSLSNLAWGLSQVKGFPSNLAVTPSQNSFRLLHRLT